MSLEILGQLASICEIKPGDPNNDYEPKVTSTMWFAAFTLWLLFWEAVGDWDRSVVSVVRTNDTNKFYLLLVRQKVKKLIPDAFTVLFFSHSPNNLTTVTENDLANYHSRTPVPSLITSRQHTPDERMRNYIQSIFAVHEPIFWKQDFFLQDACNPTIAKMPMKDLYIVSWRSFDDYDLKFGILNISSLNRTLSNSSLEDGFGFSPSQRFPIPVQQFNYDQQDPRLLVENSTSLLLSYTVFLGTRPNGKFKQSFARLGVDGSTIATIC